MSDHPLYPESLFTVTFDEAECTCTRPGGQKESVRWDALEEVLLMTTDQGPLEPDVFWVLSGGETGVVVPQGATGERALLERLQQLPGFDSRPVIEAMGCTDNRQFSCWKRVRDPDRGSGAGATTT